MTSICFCYITPFHPERGGIGRVTHSLTLELMRRGYKVFYLIFPSAITVKHVFDYPAPLEYFPSKDLLSQENINFYHDFLIKNHIDIVINQSGASSDAILYLNTGGCGAKVVSVIHNTPVWHAHHAWQQLKQPKRDSRWEWLKRILRLCLCPRLKTQLIQECRSQYARLLPRTNRLCLLSQRLIDDIHMLVGTEYDSKIMAIPNANSYPLNQTSPDKLIAEKKKAILFVGLLDHVEKQPLAMLNIWASVCEELADWHLYMIGGGRMQPFYERYVKEHNIRNVVFCGFCTPDDYYKQGSILCMTSIHEGWPMVLTEAMQHACVPILFDSFASARDIVEDGLTGHLIPPFDQADYAKQLKALALERERRDHMAIEAYHSVRRFDVRRVVDLWEECFTSLQNQSD